MTNTTHPVKRGILRNFIGGEFCDARGGARIDNVNPATGEVIGALPDSGVSDVDLAVESARAAFPAWKASGREARAKTLYAIADAIEKKKHGLALAETRDQGKPVSLSLSMDIPRAAANFRFFAGAILHESDDAFHGDGGLFNYTARKPLGVCGLITPWNLPLYLLSWKIAPALATGNTAVCKPSEFTSSTAYMLAEIFAETGLPPGVCNMVFGSGPAAGGALVTHPRVPLISFTGGTKTGAGLATAVAPQFKKVSLELGGKNANVIFADADLALAARTSVRSSFLNQGEICLCGSRIYVERSVFESFLTALRAETAKLVVGDPEDERTTVGALIHSEHRDKVESYVDIARSEGARVESGGKRPTLSAPFARGAFYEPTILTGVRADSRVQKEEIFGPVVTVTPFGDEAEAVMLANDVEYGLSASVWTRDAARAHRVAEALDVGTVWVNAWLMRDLRVPFGGAKASGLGREGGRHSLEFYTETKTVAMKW